MFTASMVERRLIAHHMAMLAIQVFTSHQHVSLTVRKILDKSAHGHQLSKLNDCLHSISIATNRTF